MHLAAISVDLDSLPHYCRIHGLDEGLLDDRARELVYRVAVDRFSELLAERSAPGTYFAVGEDLAAPVAVAALRRAHRAGVEIGNHSHTHDYALSRRSFADIDLELSRAEEAITGAVGERPVGFRAPGYTLSPALMQALCARGYRYDSSTFPAAPYYLGKAAVMAALAALGRPSRAILDTPAVLAAPRLPYTPDPQRPYRRGTAAVLELPMSVTPAVRFPFVGTFVATLPRPLVRTAFFGLRKDPVLNFELHAVDLLDESDGVLAALVSRQRDLRVSVKEKTARLREVFGWIAGEYQLVTLADLAGRLLQAQRAVPS